MSNGTGFLWSNSVDTSDITYIVFVYMCVCAFYSEIILSQNTGLINSFILLRTIKNSFLVVYYFVCLQQQPYVIFANTICLLFYFFLLLSLYLSISRLSYTFALNIKCLFQDNQKARHQISGSPCPVRRIQRHYQNQWLQTLHSELKNYQVKFIFFFLIRHLILSVIITIVQLP